MTDWEFGPSTNIQYLFNTNASVYIFSNPHHSRSLQVNHRQQMRNSTDALEIAEYPDSLSDLYGHHQTHTGPLASTLSEKVVIDPVEWLFHPPYCLGGRTTAIISSSSPGAVTCDDLMCKTSSTSVIVHGNKGIIPGSLYGHIQSDRKSELSLMYLDDVVSHGANRIWSTSSSESDKYHTLRILVSEKLLCITSLADGSFVKAWLEVVKFHAYSWNIGLQHDDPSLWNMLYNDKLKCGVLSDYDVSTSRQDLQVPGSSRTSAIPFMSIELLGDDYWHGKVTRIYRHELEAFIWILPFVFLRYQDKKPQRKTHVNSWMTADYNNCHRHKFAFISPINLPDMMELCQRNFIKHSPLVQRLLVWLFSMLSLRVDLDGMIRTDKDFDNVVELWPRFVKVLKELVVKPSSGYMANLIDELDLDNIATLGVARPLTHPA